MPVYELTIDGPAVREAEKLVSLEGRVFPTLVMAWESRLFDQLWQTTLVHDYLIALPPLMLGQATFNEVRIAAYVGGAPTKFLYFGTEMSSFTTGVVLARAIVSVWLSRTAHSARAGPGSRTASTMPDASSSNSATASSTSPGPDNSINT